jgi:hypothetical protein
VQRAGMDVLRLSGSPFTLALDIAIMEAQNNRNHRRAFTLESPGFGEVLELARSLEERLVAACSDTAGEACPSVEDREFRRASIWRLSHERNAIKDEEIDLYRRKA